MLHLLLALTVHAPASDTTVRVAPGADLDLVRVVPGVFERQVPGIGPQTVRITEAFWIGAYEVTWEVWQAVMGWDDGRGQPDHPARRMSWFDVQDFIVRVNAAAPGLQFRLPTEAEWEYAARAGETGDGAGSPDLEGRAWIRGNSGGAIQPVGTRLPNAWGIYDMQGNVWEWIADWMAPYPRDRVVVDPVGPRRGTERVRRGGSAVYGARAAAFSHRYRQPPDRGNGNLGFRLVAAPRRR